MGPRFVVAGPRPSLTPDDALGCESPGCKGPTQVMSVPLKDETTLAGGSRREQSRYRPAFAIEHS